MSELTDRQRAVLDFVTGHVQAEGLPPTVAEVATAFDINVNAAHKHLIALDSKGALTLLPGKARGLRLKTVPRSRRPDTMSLPILGRVAAGRPIGADPGFEGQRLFDRSTFFPMPDYLLRVKGDSMTGDGIFDGDLIAVKRAATADPGAIVVARLDGEITVKRLQVSRGRIRLLPRNPDYAPIEVAKDADFAIEGLYCGLVRSA